MFYHTSSLLSISSPVVMPFLNCLHRIFLFNCSCHVSFSNCSVPSYPALNSCRIGQRGLIPFTPRVSSQQPPTTPLPACLSQVYCRLQHNNDELISDVLLWTLKHGYTSVDWPANTNIGSLQTLDVVWKMFQEWWMIDGWQDSGTVWSAWLDEIFGREFH